MAIVIVGRTLRSYLTRVAAGVRTIGSLGSSGSTSSGGGVLGFFSRLAGFAFGIITKFFPLSISSIFGMLVQAYFTIKTFDWDQTDKEIQDRIAANNKAIKDGLAPVIGQYLGFGVVRLANFAIGKAFRGSATGGTSGANAVRGINIPVLSAKVGLALAEEGNEEVRGAVLGWLMTVQRALQDNLFLSFILTTRNYRLFGAEPIKNERPNGSFAEKIEKQIETLPKDWQNFAENLLEEFEEAIIEAGYVVAFEIDDYFIAQRAAASETGASTTASVGFSAGRGETP